MCFAYKFPDLGKGSVSTRLRCLGQASTSDHWRKEGGMRGGGDYRNSVHASQPIVVIKPISAVIVHVGLRFVCSFFFFLSKTILGKGGLSLLAV